MAAPLTPGPLSVEQLLEEIDRLPPDQRHELERRLAARRRKDEDEDSDRATLVWAARARLRVTVGRRLRRLIARSERGELARDELVEYQVLAQEAQRIDVEAAEALSQLVRRAGKPARGERG